MWVLALYSGYMYPPNLCSLPVSSPSIQWIYVPYKSLQLSLLTSCKFSLYLVDMCTLQHIRWICVLYSIYGGYVYSTAYTVDMCTLQQSLLNFLQVLTLYSGYASSTTYTVGMRTLQQSLLTSCEFSLCMVASRCASTALSSCTKRSRRSLSSRRPAISFSSARILRARSSFWLCIMPISCTAHNGLSVISGTCCTTTTAAVKPCF